ncbi:MAG: MaoC family dehydratase [Pseudomonadota bacterium]
MSTFPVRRTIDEFRDMVGTEYGVSRWYDITQDMIDQFADLTEDHQFIHVDPERAAKETPFGGAIAHGFLTLSMMSAMSYEAGPGLKGLVHGVNYGMDKMRFLSPVPAGARVRGRFTLLELDETKPGEVTYKNAVTVEIEGHDRPAIYAEWIGRGYFGEAA